MRLLTKTTVVIGLMLGLATCGLAAQGRAKGKQQARHEGDSQTTVAVGVSITHGDQRIIQEWFAQPSNMKGLPPGLAKKEQLPPGLQKQLARNGQLPPGLQKKIQPLPPTLETRLSRLPEGRRRVIINGSIVLLDEKKNLILDIMAAF